MTAPLKPAPLRDRIERCLKRGNVLTTPAAVSMFGCDARSAGTVLAQLEADGLVTCDRRRRLRNEPFVYRWAGGKR